ncbi:MAG: hypothetical protein NC833_03070 [Candidatus Omnitrophica bacterium]|nr:hypothetical protein [Candidatus Omnitrophota bacterium]
MKTDIAYTKDCPFVARKCKADKCLAWEKETNDEGYCIILKYEKEKEASHSISSSR